MHLNKEYVNIPQAYTQNVCETHNILKHNFSLGQCRREKKGREQVERKTDRTSSSSLPSLHVVFWRIFSIRSLHYLGDWRNLIRHSRVNPKHIFENEGKCEVFKRKQWVFILYM